MDPRSAPKAGEHWRRVTPDGVEPDPHQHSQSRKPNKTGVHYRFLLRAEKLNQQFIDADFTLTPTEKYAKWIERRAERLAEEGNAFLAALRTPLDLHQAASGGS